MNDGHARALLIALLVAIPTLVLGATGQLLSQSQELARSGSPSQPLATGLTTCVPDALPQLENGSQCFAGFVYDYRTVGFPNTSTENFTPPGENYVAPRWTWNTTETVSWQNYSFTFSYSICCNSGLGNGSAALDGEVQEDSGSSFGVTVWAEFRSSGWATSLVPDRSAGLQWGFGPFVRLLVAEMQ